MTPLKTETLDLTFEDNMAHITVSGAMAKETLEAGLNWIDEVVEANDNFSIRVDMAKDDFADLGEISSEFTRVGRMLRHASLEEEVGADKCAVLTDSLFLRNSAKVEGAVIPGLELNTFSLEAADVAESWLKDEPLLEESPKAAAPTQAHASAGPAPTDIKTAAPAQMKELKQELKPGMAEEPENPWGGFKAL